MNVEERRAQILARIRPLIEAKGYDAVSVDEMARASGVAKATFYRAYPAKEAVRQALGAAGFTTALLDARDGREILLEAATKVFAAEGYARATIDAIAAAAGMSKAGFYWHFASKEAVFAAIIEQFNPFDALAGAIHAADASGLDIEGVLTTAFTTVLHDLLPRRDLFRVAFFEITTNPDLATMFDHFIVGQALPILGHYLEGQITAGVLQPMPITVAAHLLIGPLSFHLFTRDRWETRFGVVLSVEEIVARIVRSFVAGNQVREE